MLLSTKFLTIDKNKIENTFLSSTPIGSSKADCETTVSLIKPNHKETVKSKAQL